MVSLVTLPNIEIFQRGIIRQCLEDLDHVLFQLRIAQRERLQTLQRRLQHTSHFARRTYALDDHVYHCIDHLLHVSKQSSLEGIVLSERLYLFLILLKFFPMYNDFNCRCLFSSLRRVGISLSISRQRHSHRSDRSRDALPQPVTSRLARLGIDAKRTAWSRMNASNGFPERRKSNLFRWLFE